MLGAENPQPPPEQPQPQHQEQQQPSFIPGQDPKQQPHHVPQHFPPAPYQQHPGQHPVQYMHLPPLQPGQTPQQYHPFPPMSQGQPAGPFMPFPPPQQFVTLPPPKPGQPVPSLPPLPPHAYKPLNGTTHPPAAAVPPAVTAPLAAPVHQSANSAQKAAAVAKWLRDTPLLDAQDGLPDDAEEQGKDQGQGEDLKDGKKVPESIATPVETSPQPMAVPQGTSLGRPKKPSFSGSSANPPNAPHSMSHGMPARPVSPSSQVPSSLFPNASVQSYGSPAFPQLPGAHFPQVQGNPSVASEGPVPPVGNLQRTISITKPVPKELSDTFRRASFRTTERPSPAALGMPRSSSPVAENVQSGSPGVAAGAAAAAEEDELGGGDAGSPPVVGEPSEGLKHQRSTSRHDDDTASVLDGRQMLGDDYDSNSVSDEESPPGNQQSGPHLGGEQPHRDSLVPSLSGSRTSTDSFTLGDGTTLDGTIELGEAADGDSESGSVSSSALNNAGSFVERMELMKFRIKKSHDKVHIFDGARFIVDNVQYLPQAEQKPYCELAIRTLKKLSHAGMPEAQYLLANLYISGIPGFHEKHKPDYAKAFTLYAGAAKKEHVEALFHVGLCYEQGAGVTQSNGRALHNYRKAAVSNHPGAMFRLGMSLLRGDLNQSKNPRDGVKWLKLAAKYANEKYPQALYELALLHDKGVPNVVWPDHEYLLELLMQAASLGHGPSQYKLGEAFEYGNYGATIDPGRSVYYYSLAAANGNLEAMFELGGWYLTGADDPKTDFHLIQSDHEASRWVGLAAQGGLPKAMFAMGYFCEMGIGSGVKDMKAAVEWYKKAAELKDPKAVKKLGELGVKVVTSGRKKKSAG
ncbi:hypothetical protein HK104_009141, partial [Borealophlyctis nickersoniae]